MEHPTRQEAPAVIAGFWKRIFAMCVDGLLLAALGYGCAFSFTNQLIALGQNGRLIGLGVSILYFGILNSSAGGSLGKRLLGLRVVRRNGANISLLRSFIRALFYLVPIYLNGWFFDLPPLSPLQQIVFATLDFTLVFGFLFANIYLYIANVATRQTLHDLIAGTFVVRADSAGAAVSTRTHRIHFIVVGAWLLVFLAGIPLGWGHFEAFLASNPFGIDTKGLTAIYDAVRAEPGVRAAQVTQNTSTYWSSKDQRTTTTSLAVLVIVDHPVDEAGQQRIAIAVGRRVLATSPNILGRQKLAVTVRYGYDIGVCSWWNAKNFDDTLDNWKAVTTGKHPAQKPK